MNKKILIISFLLILAIAFILKYFPDVITGLISQIVNLSVGIQNSTLARFVYFSYPSEITLGNSATFSVNLQNIGSVNITTGIEIHVKNSLLTTVSSSYDVNYTLAPLEIRSFSAIYTPTSAGTYWVIANATYNSTFETKTVEEYRSFNVTTAPVIPAYPVYPGVYIPPMVYVYNLTLEYPKQINLTQNESYIIPIYATNYGNADIHNLSLYVTLEGIRWKINPESLAALPPKTTVIFLISLKVPSDAEIKDYILNFMLDSKEIKRKGEIAITVLAYPIEFCPEVERAIRNYASLIDRVSIEIERAASQGRNVTLALKYFREARKEFDLVKDFFNLKDCESAKQHLELVRKCLELTVIELARSIIPSSPLLFYIIIIILTAIAISTIIIVTKKKKLLIITKPMISVLLEDREKSREELKNLEKVYKKKQINEVEYRLKKSKLEKEIEKIETEIIMRFGTERQLSLLEDVKKAYIEGIINKKIYNKTRERLVNKIVMGQKR